MFRKILLFLSLLVFLSQFSNHAFAQSKQFSIDTDLVYSISDDGTTDVTQNIHLKNKTDYIYTPTYTLYPGVTDISDVSVTSPNGNLPFEVMDTNGKKSIKVIFKERITGTAKTNNFTIDYTTHDIAHRLGQIWQIAVPGISDPALYDNYSVVLRVPQSFGKATILKPSPFASFTAATKEENKNEVSYSKKEIGKAGIFLEFGDTQYYSFNLQYHLENPNFFPINSDIALPPDSAYQDISITQINPQPSNVTEDVNGNWIATYKLSPHERRDIEVDGAAKTYAMPRPSVLSQDLAGIYKKSQQYWEVDNDEIQQLAHDLKTPDAIYEYVRTKLSYNNEKVVKDNKRLGAYGALQDPTYAVCLEFTDLFVALARAAGIPAREVEGYAYSQSSTLKPLSANRDILHTWPEYYDFAQKTWISVDPTWGNTTHGSDYFNSMDFEHITFVVNGDNSTYPIPAGGYKLNPNSHDITVNFADSSNFVVSAKGEMIDDLPRFSVAGLGVAGQVLIKNHGTTPLSGFTFTVDSALDPQHKVYTVGKVPPFGTLAVPVLFHAPSILTNASFDVTIHSGSSHLSHTITVGLLPNREWWIIGGVFIIGIYIIFIITRKTRSLFVSQHKR